MKLIFYVRINIIFQELKKKLSETSAVHMQLPSILPYSFVNPTGWRCKIHRLHLCREVRPPHTHTTSVLDMTLNHLMARLQPGRFGEYGVCLYCYGSQIHSDPEW